jgi:ribosomal protein L23
MIHYYISYGNDINKDGMKEDMILKYNDTKFIVGMPLHGKNIDILQLFKNKPKIPKKHYVVFTHKDLNKDKIKDHIASFFTLKGTHIVSVALNLSIHKGGAQYVDEKHNAVYVKNETDFSQYIKAGAGHQLGASLMQSAMDAVCSAFEE